MESRNLAAVVEAVRTSLAPGMPLTDSLREAIAQHDRMRCVAEIAFVDLWNGEGASGLVSPKAFWDQVVHIWHNAPEFFVADDSGRMINEDSKVWDQRYLDVQRNYLRHNFSLRRFCHLVMVYEYLHDENARDSRREDKREPPNVPSQTATRMTPQGKLGRGSWVGVTSFASLIILVGVSMYCLGRRHGGDGRTSSATNAASEIIVADDSDKESARDTSATNVVSAIAKADVSDKEYARAHSATNVVSAIAKADDLDKKSPRVPVKETTMPKPVATALAQQKTNGVASIVVLQERTRKVQNPPVKRTIKDNAK